MGSLEDKIAELVAFARSASPMIRPKVIKTKAEARSVSAADPLKDVWHVGDEYFIVSREGGQIVVKA